MRMQSKMKQNNRMKKSQVLLLGSLLVFCGLIFISWDYFKMLRDEIYSDMKIMMMGNNVSEPNESREEVNNEFSFVASESNNYVDNTIDYSKYLGVLQIPKIWLKRGFYNVDSKYNNVDSNVTLVDGSVMPDEQAGNLILMAHSGDAYVSYFSQLYKLSIGDECFILYNGQAYHYVITKIYDVDKIGAVGIDSNPDTANLILITCTKDKDNLQTIYVAEQVD